MHPMYKTPQNALWAYVYIQHHVYILYVVKDILCDAYHILIYGIPYVFWHPTIRNYKNALSLRALYTAVKIPPEIFPEV